MIDKDKKKLIENEFKELLLEYQIKDYESKTALKFQFIFFKGVLCNLNQEDIPAIWLICLMLGRSILKESEVKS